MPLLIYNFVMKMSPYVISDLSSLLIKYFEHSGIIAPEIEAQIRAYADQSQMSQQQWRMHLGSLAELTANPNIGLDIAELIEPSHCGILGYLVSTCESLGEAFLNFERYQHVLYGTVGQISLAGEHVVVSWPKTEKVNESPFSDQILLAAMVYLARSMSGIKTLTPVEVGFLHAKPENIEKYVSVFGDKVHFDSQYLYARYPLNFFNVPILHSDPALKKILISQITSLRNTYDQSSQFERLLQGEVIKILQEGNPNLPALAKAMKTPVRTLQRHLADRQLTFKNLLEDTRKELSHIYLLEHKLSLVDTSFLLGYSEQSAFARAFKRWYGISPNKYKKKHLTECID